MDATTGTKVQRFTPSVNSLAVMSAEETLIEFFDVLDDPVEIVGGEMNQHGGMNFCPQLDEGHFNVNFHLNVNSILNSSVLFFFTLVLDVVFHWATEISGNVDHTEYAYG